MDPKILKSFTSVDPPPSDETNFLSRCGLFKTDGDDKSMEESLKESMNYIFIGIKTHLFMCGRHFRSLRAELASDGCDNLLLRPGMDRPLMTLGESRDWVNRWAEVGDILKGNTAYWLHFEWFRENWIPAIDKDALLEEIVEKPFAAGKVVEETSVKQKPYTMFYHNPWLALGTMSRAITYYHRLGTITASQAHQVQICMHLYNALRKEGYMKEPLALFEFLMRYYGKRAFLGRVPDEGYHKALALACFKNPVHYAKGGEYSRTGKAEPKNLPTFEKIVKHMLVLPKDSMIFEYTFGHTNQFQPKREFGLEDLRRHAAGGDTRSGNRRVASLIHDDDGQNHIIEVMDTFLEVAEREQKETFLNGIDWLAFEVSKPFTLNPA
ncbi:hypothetical protein HK097_003414 [Rhizophlyctis rosea]|uniref:Uncharacterized protein n=1 Tax=Rhizophlyctis rosea TaxID=64517 RepID=A0AAD5SGL7_9FUNG|nr:hypothetical protein HK097_003414 [Rhizophlyctis rosea]